MLHFVRSFNLLNHNPLPYYMCFDIGLRVKSDKEEAFTACTVLLVIVVALYDQVFYQSLNDHPSLLYHLIPKQGCRVTILHISE